MKDVLIEKLRQVKHGAFLAKKNSRIAWHLTMARAFETGTAIARMGRPYKYQPGMYRRVFLNLDQPDRSHPGPLPRVIYCFWTGENKLNENRLAGLKALEERAGVPVKLITPNEVPDYIVEGHPFHPAYEHLSLVHKSDYLRAYFMHHHGGGYSDIKATYHDWNPLFDQIDEDTDAWVLAYRESTSLYTAHMPKKLGHDISANYKLMVAVSAFIVRARTSFTAEWMAELHRRLNYHQDLLAAFPGGIRNENPNYPISWNRILAQIIHPLSLKYHDRIRFDQRLEPNTKDYR